MKPATSAASPVSTRLDSLTGARFVAALAVFFYHARESFGSTDLFGKSMSFIGANGASGVTFFFVLSGFVLAWSWRSGGSTTAFYRRRFARIAPAYWVAFLYGLVWTIFQYHDPIAATLRALPSLIGLQAWYPDPAVHFAANGVEWSVSAELFFYALFPLLIRLTERRGGLLALGCVGATLAFVAPLVLPHVLPWNLTSWAINVLPATRIGEFACGIVLAALLRNGARSPLRAHSSLVLVLAAYFLLPLAPTWVPRQPIFLITVLLAIAALAQADLRGERSFLASRTMVRLGTWSYCFYLVHQVTTRIVIFMTGTFFAPSPLRGPMCIAVALVLSIALAWALYRFVEHPLERRLRLAPSASAAREERLPTDTRAVRAGTTTLRRPAARASNL